MMSDVAAVSSPFVTDASPPVRGSSRTTPTTQATPAERSSTAEMRRLRGAGGNFEGAGARSRALSPFSFPTLDIYSTYDGDSETELILNN